MVYTQARLEHALRVFRKCEGIQASSHASLDRYKRRELRKTTKTARNWQIWNSPQAQNDSEEDEYCPLEDRRRSNATRRRKGGNHSKRKTRDMEDKDRSMKLTKAGDVLDNAVYLTLRITSEKGRTKLKELSHTHENESKHSMQYHTGDQAEPTYWRSNNDSQAERKRKRSQYESAPRRSGDHIEGDRETDDDIQGGTRDSSGVVKRTSLRSGRVLERSIDRPSKVASDSAITDQEHKEVTEEGSPICTPSVPTRLSTTSNIVLVGSTLNKTATVKHTKNDSQEPTKLARRSELPSQMGNSPSAPARSSASSVEHQSKALSGQQPSKFRDDSGVIRLETFYAHPINFTYQPKSGESPCDFCADWAMGIVGLGIKHVLLVQNPRNRTQLLEIGAGHREAGKPPTKVCIRCSLKYLMVMRCHNLRNESGAATNKSGPKLLRLRSPQPDSKVIQAYTDHLKLKMAGNAERYVATTQEPFPICSLCARPAMYKCCKWQQFDHLMRPCRLPTVAIQARTGSAIDVPRPLSSSGASQNQPSKSTSAPEKAAPVVISLLDSDSDSDSDDKPKQRPQITSNPTHLTNDHTPQSSRFTKPANKEPTQPSLSGCGLHLCSKCYIIVQHQCGGLLDKPKIMTGLNKYSLGTRADIDWLFPGSLLERTIERR